ncbi:9,9'-di-cis-zeta-carotene desaturase [Pseudanabaena yagii]|uniref:9,9'-di-cis-zeta-carotene desaturase n=1 Tax=Pseudanabaena yagii GIHE-NHR1 TaxID=2722753 RepID=A0ABX1LM24_9CYAN|nr:9,9'-di-cis-zeta-carotene desaturase [Pseudanabaena yagii]NMF57167.1 9,9'-di-cis-zeta-carotene desaturase [Pseudanabaena yagii GIHE-NHR1]
MKAAIIGAGLAGMSTAVELSEQGYEVELFESRPFVGGKVSSWLDKDGNHIEMGLHVFFGCYYNLFALMKKTGAFKHLRLKEHTHIFVNPGGAQAALDFRNFGGAPFHGLKAFVTTGQLPLKDKIQNAIAIGRSPLIRGLVDHVGAMKEIRALDNISFKDWFLGMGGSQASLDLMWDAIAYGLGFIDCENISARCMLTIFQFFASRTEASILRMLEGSPEVFLHQPIVKHIESKGGKFHLRRGVREVLFEGEGEDTRVTGLIVGKEDGEEIVTADVYICATDIPGVKRIIPEKWRAWSQFDNIYKLDAVPVITVQLRFDGWVTDIDNLLYAVKVDFSTFADLAITSPTDYYKEGEGSLLQLVITPADDYIKLSNEAIVEKMIAQVHQIFPSSNKLNVTWSSVVKLAQSLYREAPGKDPFRPAQATPVKNFFLAGSYTMQDYIDSMEGATLSGRMCAAEVIKSKQLAKV